MSRIINRLSLFAALTCVAAVAPTAARAQTFYSSLAAFNAAATTVKVYDFEGITTFFAWNPAVLTTPAPGRITFSVSGGDGTDVYAADSTFSSGYYTLSDGSDSVIAGRPSSSSSTTRINLDNSYLAFGIEYGMQQNLVNLYSFALFNDDTQVGASFNPGIVSGDLFFGATSDTPFNNVRVTAATPQLPDKSVVFDNARTGAAFVAPAVAVPEASTFALALPALAIVGAVIIKRRKK